MEYKQESSHAENGVESCKSEFDVPVDRIQTVDIENYHGLTTRTVLVYFSLCLLLVAQMLNLVGSGAFARSITTAVGGSDKAAWLSSIVAIETCVLGPPISQAADYWGRKWFLVIPATFGFVGSLVIARGDSMSIVIGGEIIAAVSFGSQPLMYAVGSEILPRRWRPEAQAGLNISLGIGAVFTLLVGLKLTNASLHGFRTFYYIAAGLNGLAAIICAALYTPPLRDLQKSLDFRGKMAKLDWIGYILLASGVVLFIVALSWSQNPYSWTNAHILGPFILGCALLIAFVLHQWKFKRDGMLHHDLFKKDRNFAIALFSLFVEGIVFYAINNYYVYEMSVIYDTDDYIPGVRFVVIFILSMVGSAVVALYVSATKKLRLPSVFAFILFVIFLILMATAKLSSGKAMWGYSIFVGIGLGIILTTLVTAAQLSAPPHLMYNHLLAITSGLLISVRSLGGAIGLAIYNAVFDAKISTSLPTEIAGAVVPLGISPKDLPAFIGALASNNQTALMQVPGVTPQIIGAGVKGLQQAYLESFRYVWVAAGAFSVIAIFASAFLINPKKDMNMHVDAPLEED